MYPSAGAPCAYSKEFPAAVGKCTLTWAILVPAGLHPKYRVKGSDPSGGFAEFSHRILSSGVIVEQTFPFSPKA